MILGILEILGIPDYSRVFGIWDSGDFGDSEYSKILEIQKFWHFCEASSETSISH